MENYWDLLSSFTLAEIVDMEKVYKEIGPASINQEVCQTLATTFSCSLSRYGKSLITWEQVQCWFKAKDKPEELRAGEEKELQAEEKAKTEKFIILPQQNKWRVGIFDLDNMASDLDDIASEELQTPQKPKGRVSDLVDLAFEARSARDHAWYDVGTFLTYRHVQGELETRVRYAGFEKSHDEWVNAKTEIRERSIPMEPSECHKAKAGDLMLCLQTRENYDLYCDAYIVDIQRRMHGFKTCDCKFVVRFEHDNSLETVDLKRLCRRP